MQCILVAPRRTRRAETIHRCVERGCNQASTVIDRTAHMRRKRVWQSARQQLNHRNIVRQARIEHRTFHGTEESTHHTGGAFRPTRRGEKSFALGTGERFFAPTTPRCQKRRHRHFKQGLISREKMRFAISQHIQIRGIVADIGADVVQRPRIAHDDVVIVALPGRIAVQQFCDADFEPAHNRSNRTGCAAGAGGTGRYGRKIFHPYGMDGDNAMDVIRHNHPFVQRNLREMLWNIAPASGCNPPRIVQHHLSVDHRTEQRAILRNTDRHEINPAPRIIVSTQPDRTSVMDRWVVFMFRLFQWLSHSRDR